MSQQHQQHNRGGYRRESFFTVVSYGTRHAFNPTKKGVDYSNDKSILKPLLEIHLDYVRMMNDDNVFILDNKGNVVEIN